MVIGHHIKHGWDLLCYVYRKTNFHLSLSIVETKKGIIEINCQNKKGASFGVQQYNS